MRRKHTSSLLNTWIRKFQALLPSPWVLSWSWERPNLGFVVVIGIALVASVAASGGDDGGDTIRSQTRVTTAPTRVPAQATAAAAPSTPEPTATPAGAVVTFPDSALEAGIREALGKPEGDITTQDMGRLTTLVATGRGSRLTGGTGGFGI